VRLGRDARLNERWTGARSLLHEIDMFSTSPSWTMCCNRLDGSARLVRYQESHCPLSRSLFRAAPEPESAGAKDIRNCHCAATGVECALHVLRYETCVENALLSAKNSFASSSTTCPACESPLDDSPTLGYFALEDEPRMQISALSRNLATTILRYKRPMRVHQQLSSWVQFCTNVMSLFRDRLKRVPMPLYSSPQVIVLALTCGAVAAIAYSFTNGKRDTLIDSVFGLKRRDPERERLLQQPHAYSTRTSCRQRSHQASKYICRRHRALRRSGSSAFLQYTDYAYRGEGRCGGPPSAFRICHSESLAYAGSHNPFTSAQTRPAGAEADIRSATRRHMAVRHLPQLNCPQEPAMHHV
jgi:hypothetical protein